VLMEFVVSDNDLGPFLVGEFKLFSSVLDPMKTCEKMVFKSWNKVLFLPSDEITLKCYKKDAPLLLDHHLAVH
jgi:hypothetical protein